MNVASTEAWGEPLGDMLARVLAENLQQRMPGSSVFTEAGGLSAEADATVEIDVQRFDSGAESATTLLAQVAVQRGSDRAGATSRSIRPDRRGAGREYRRPGRDDEPCWSPNWPTRSRPCSPRANRASRRRQRANKY